VKTEKKYCCQWVLYGVKRNIVANEAHFWDCCSNVGHFLCGVAKVKRYVNVYLHLCRQQPEMDKWMSTCLPWKNFCGRPCLYYLCLQSNICFVLVLFEYLLFQPLGKRVIECAIHHQRGMLEDLQPYICGANRRRLKPIYM